MSIIPDTPPALYFEVDGLPAPQGSKAFNGISKKSGHAILAESSKKVKPWRKAVEEAARKAQGPDWEPIDGPVLLVVEFYMPRPKGHPKNRRTLPDRTPDLSKLLRSTEDAMTYAGTYADDGRIVGHVQRERYATDLDAFRLPWERRAVGAKIALWRVDPAASMFESPLIVRPHPTSDGA